MNIRGKNGKYLSGDPLSYVRAIPRFGIIAIAVSRSSLRPKGERARAIARLTNVA